MADQDSRSGVRYAGPELTAYVDRVHAGHDASLLRAFEAPSKNEMPQIQVGASEGKLLTLLMRLIGARNVVEVGTLAGYSAVRIARGLAPEGKLWSLELDARHAQVARANLAAAGFAERVAVLVGPALETLATLASHGPFDAVFVDADKSGYLDYARWAHAHLRPGGLLIADNAYLFGQLMADTENAARMREFHEFVATSFDSVCVPTPDGMVIGLR
ncbi:MAG TPA: O-methyltransferase [Polyangiales bacterium]|nr:O-methyltransferase [Polyangiales bacterium]